MSSPDGHVVVDRAAVSTATAQIRHAAVAALDARSALADAPLPPGFAGAAYRDAESAVLAGLTTVADVCRAWHDALRASADAVDTAVRGSVGTDDASASSLHGSLRGLGPT